MEADGDAAEEHPDALPRGAVLHTTRGDISVKLFPDECPQTVENFATHARNGYYDHVIFHRVIKGFCIQTGDPLGMPTVCIGLYAQVCLQYPHLCLADASKDADVDPQSSPSPFIAAQHWTFSGEPPPLACWERVMPAIGSCVMLLASPARVTSTYQGSAVTQTLIEWSSAGSSKAV